MIGRVLAGRYELGEVIGQGGMAVVHRGHDRTLGRDVAIKLLREQFAADPEFLERFQREARAAARLSHPNIVDVFDVGSDDGTQYIVMELVEGENLKDLIRRAAPLNPARLIALGREVASALDYAHRRGLVHRDVKPQNVLIDPDGRARLTDFGIAQAAEQAGLTQTGTVMGTAQYMAPEQARGEGTGPASDIYSLGVVLYELGTGRLPFEGQNPLSVAIQHVQATPPPPRQLNPSLPPALEAAILRAMAKEPERRYASAAALARALVTGPDPVAERTAAVPAAGGRRPPSSAPTEATRVRRADDRVVVPVSPRQRLPGARPARRPPSGTGPGSMILLVLLVLLSLLFLLLGFNWLFGAGGPPPRPEPTAAPSPTTAPAPAVPTTAARPTATRPAPTATPPPPTEAPSPTAEPTAAPTPTRVPPTTAPPPPPTKPAARATVPNLVGLSLGEAQVQVATQNLILEFTNAERPNLPNGVVLDQNPRAGESVPQRSVVRVVVNRVAASLVPVPNVGGLEEEEARAALQKEGFKVKVERDRGGRKGVVYDQSPQPGARVAPGTEVTVVIGS